MHHEVEVFDFIGDLVLESENEDDEGVDEENVGNIADEGTVGTEPSCKDK